MVITMTTAYETVQKARANGRATALDYINNIFTDFTEMHGDRRFSDDTAIVAGIARLGDMPVTAIGLEKGGDVKDRASRNFGSAQPEGYRKALRQMKQAEKFGRPIICFVDTSGAYCGIGAEERGQGQAIAENLWSMMTLKVPIISIIIGEGGSGGALALAVADEVWILEGAIYSVISPEGCASILWKDSAKAADAAECLKLTSRELYRQGVVERVISEKLGQQQIYETLARLLGETLTALSSENIENVLTKRYARFRKFGA